MKAKVLNETGQKAVVEMVDKSLGSKMERTPVEIPKDISLKEINISSL